MPVNNLKQATLNLSRAQLESIGSLAEHPGARTGARIEETNIGNAIAVITLPGKKIHIITWDGTITEMGQEK